MPEGVVTACRLRSSRQLPQPVASLPLLLHHCCQCLSLRFWQLCRCLCGLQSLSEVCMQRLCGRCVVICSLLTGFFNHSSTWGGQSKLQVLFTKCQLRSMPTSTYSGIQCLRKQVLILCFHWSSATMELTERSVIGILTLLKIDVSPPLNNITWLACLHVSTSAKMKLRPVCTTRY